MSASSPDVYSSFCTFTVTKRMIPFRETGPHDAANVFVLLHFFGGSHREWQGVSPLLAKEHRVIAADLPGFGEAASLTGFSVQQMADRIRELIGYLAPARVVLVGHSMSGKAAMVAAAKPAENLQGLALLAPSPLAGEPMNETARADMAIANTTRERAEAFARAGFYRKPSADVFETAVEDVLRASDDAFHAWPESGTREDWSTRVTKLGVPSILIVGEHDQAIAPDLQREQTLPLVEATGGKMHLLQDAAHLTPYECPNEVATLLLNFAKSLR